MNTMQPDEFDDEGDDNEISQESDDFDDAEQSEPAQVGSPAKRSTSNPVIVNR